MPDSEKEEPDLKEAGDLTNKDLIKSLLAEQAKLEKRQKHLQSTLEKASLDHSKMTEILIKRLEHFTSEVN